MTDFSYKDLLKILMPKGPVWAMKPLGDMDKLFETIGEVKDTIRTYLKSIAYLRNPNLTPILADLEREFGVVPVTSLTESERRQILAGYVYAKPGSGKDDLEARLHAAGFTELSVYHNDPEVDPDTYVSGDWAMVLGHEDAVLGHQDAYLGQQGVGGYVLANGDVYKADGTLAEYSIPSDDERWPLVFFIGGERTATTGGYVVILDGDMEYGSDPDNILLDGDMDYPDTSFWSDDGDSSLDKELRSGGGGEVV